MDRRGPRQYADDLERGTLSLPEEKMPDTDREARLEGIRADWADINDISTPAYENSLETVRDVRWLLSEVDRLKVTQQEGET